MTKASTKFRTQYDLNYKSEVFATPIGEDEGLVQQHMRDECDINVIMARYQKTGVLTHIQSQVGEYGDFSGVLDYQSGLEQIRLAEEMFYELPSSVRDRFKNDPGRFIDFASDPNNLGEMRDMGLAPPAPEPNTRSPSGEPKSAPADAPGVAPSKAQTEPTKSSEK